jgi:hypothetical protein
MAAPRPADLNGTPNVHLWSNFEPWLEHRTQADVQGRGIAAKAGLSPTVDDVAPASAGDPSGRPLLSGFYSTFTAIVPQGSGAALLRSIEYSGGNGAQTPIVTLAIWAAAGGVLAIFAAVLATR